MRHGHSRANEEGLIISNPSSAISGYGLTQKGEDEVRKVATLLRGHINGSPIVCSSDFLRAQRTAEIMVDQLGGKLMVDKRLRERDFGKLNGQSDLRYHEVWDLDSNLDNDIFDVESVRNLVERVKGLLDSLESRFSGEDIILVSHGDPLMAINTYVQHGDIKFLVPDFENAEVRLLGSSAALI